MAITSRWLRAASMQNSPSLRTLWQSHPICCYACEKLDQKWWQAPPPPTCRKHFITLLTDSTLFFTQLLHVDQATNYKMNLSQCSCEHLRQGLQWSSPLTSRIFFLTFIVCVRCIFSIPDRSYGAYSMWLTRGQQAMQPVYISVRVLPVWTYLLN